MNKEKKKPVAHLIDHCLYDKKSEYNFKLNVN